MINCETKYAISFSSLKVNKLVKHLHGLSQTALYTELLFGNLIHPDGSESAKEGFNNAEVFKFEKNKSIEENLSNLPHKDEAGIYGIFYNSKNIYIGETSRTFEQRINEHFQELKHNQHANKDMQKDYNDGKLTSIKIIFFECGKPIEITRLLFKIYCLFREHYYQELFNTDAYYHCLNKENTLKKLYDSKEYSDYNFDNNKGTYSTAILYLGGSRFPRNLNDLQNGEYRQKSIEEYSIEKNFEKCWQEFFHEMYENYK